MKPEFKKTTLSEESVVFCSFIIKGLTCRIVRNALLTHQLLAIPSTLNTTPVI